MKKIGILLCAVALVLLCRVPASAANDNLHPNAVYELTDSKGKAISIQFDYKNCKFLNFPKKGDTVKIWLDGNKNKDPDEIAVCNDAGSFKKTKGEGKIFLGKVGATGKDYNYNNSTVKLTFSTSKSYNNAYNYYIKQDVKVAAQTPAIEKMVYSPSSISVKASQIATSAVNGTQTYSVWLRNVHEDPDGGIVYSPFYEGESVKLDLSDGSSETYYCKEVYIPDYGWRVAFESKSGEVMQLETGTSDAEMYLKKGSNKVGVYISGRKDVDPFILTVNVVDTSGSGGSSDSKDSSASGSSSGSGSSAGKTADNSSAKAVSVVKAKSVKAKKSGKTIKVSWKKLTKKQQKKVNKIQIQYSTKKNFKKSKSVYVKKSKASYKIRNLKKKTYYIRVRNIRKSDGKTYKSKWSNVKKVKIK